MNIDLQKQYVRNEYIQTYFRLFFIAVSVIAITYYTFVEHALSVEVYKYIMLFPVLMLSLIAVYMFIVYKYPYFLQNQRIVFMSFVETTATGYVMYLTGPLSAYFPALLLWFCIGYGVRYGEKIGFVTYGIVLITWLVLLNTSPFWIQNRALGFGWFIAYLVIPLYFFKLLQKLHSDVKTFNYKATHDPLTGLPNRFLFDEVLYQYLKGKNFALIFVDLDGFKEINDSFGHLTGDKVLVEASKRIEQITDFTSRLGGDEFVCIMTFKTKDELKKRLDRLVENLHKTCPNKRITISASIGVSLYPNDTFSAHELKKKADAAMYKAKESGKNRYFLYSELAS
ncbi:GGDEF domain-containing protein [Sulfurimonas sp. NW15]|uniref:GGDEF domain-containing protein n=1 Tax=Sulfurimonas sp. NW15 TaxID=2922729 RepID=UPI003DA837A9